MNAVPQRNIRADVPRPANETQRLAAVQRLQLLGTPPDPDFDFLCELAAQLCNAPFAAVSLVDRDRVWIKAGVGITPGAVPRDETCCAWSVLEPEGLHIADLAADPRTAALPRIRGAPRYRMYAAANLRTADDLCVGTLCVLDTQPRTLTPEQSQGLARLARQATALIELRAHRRLLADALAAMDTLATVDELTGLANRRVLMERLAQEVERARRFGLPLAVVLVDLDQFKSVNAMHGHAVGDEVLKNVGRQIRNHLRQLDLAGLLAGEQFCLILPGTTPAGGEQVAQSLRQTIAGYVHRCDAQLLSVTASFGVAGLEPGMTATVAELLKRADDALVRAKVAGRNRVASE
jgi:diguanylate cyclase (GGDEF)-like protein